MKKINFSLSKIFMNDRFSLIISFVLAVIFWAFVSSSTSYTTDQRTIYDVPVKINTAGAIDSLGLAVSEGGEQTVKVTIQGKKFDIAKISKEDLVMEAQTSLVTQAQEYELEIRPEQLNDKYTVISIEPKTINVKFANIKEVTIPVTPDAKGVTVPDGYVMGTVLAGMDKATLRGKAEDIDRVEAVQAIADVNEELSNTSVFKVRLKAVDADGNEITGIKFNESETDIKVPILKAKEVPVKVKYKNVPDKYKNNPDDFFTISPSTIHIAVPPDQVDNYNELEVGEVDFNNLDVGGSLNFDVILQQGFKNINSIQSVEVKPVFTGLRSKTVDVSNFSFINAPDGFNASPVTKSIKNVKIVGPASVIRNLKASQVIAIVDLSSSDLSQGQKEVPVSFKVDGSDECWGYGQFTVVIQASKG